MTMCSVKECGRPLIARGLCTLHYQRWAKSGDPGSAVPRRGRPLVERLADITGKPDECWPWTDSRNSAGYGSVAIGGNTREVHRVVYELFVGPIPEGSEIDHLCHTRDASCPGGRGCPHRACCNPAHLEAVTRHENWRRGRSCSALNATKTECKNGHPFDEANTRIESTKHGTARVCRACQRAAALRYKRRKAIR